MASLASHKSPEKSIPLLSKIITGNVLDESFTYTIYPNPHRQVSKIKKYLIDFFGNRIQNGEHCLGITEAIVKENIETKNLNALIHLKNNNIEDSATCALQYADHCNKGSKQLWISDLCRVKSHDNKIISPVKILFEVVKDFSIKNGLTEIYLMVERDKPGTEKLLEIYGKYGFKVVESCVIDHVIAMKQSLISINNLANNFSRMSIRGDGVNSMNGVNGMNSMNSVNGVNSVNSVNGRRRRTQKKKKI
jgi:hypothetical protein